MQVSATLDVNGSILHWQGEPRRSLLDALRDDLGLCGTHAGCENGECGACTVLFDGKAIRSCLLLAIQAQGHSIQTIEGVSTEDGLNPVQKALTKHHGLQCGYCTPAMVLSIIDMMASGRLNEFQSRLNDDPIANSNVLSDLLDGQLCRCTGYTGIVASLQELCSVPVGDPPPGDSPAGDPPAATPSTGPRFLEQQ